MSDFRDAIKKRLGRLDQLFAETKFDEALTYYADDFKGIYPGQPIMKDKAVFKAFLEKCYAAAGKYEQELVEIRPLGENNACVIGIVRYFDGEGKVIQQLKVVNCFRKVNGEWYIHLEIANSDAAQTNTVFDHSKLDS